MPACDTPPITDVLPPEKLLATEDRSLIRGGIACIHDVETVRQYVAYENQHRTRTDVLRLLAERADTLRETER